ncbi:hypothetical protein TYRP_011730 [Tyrophagus putrescentiae]|nr:hypothetical protein TYRP_011730 [Tyrophagus putrescentiae]
MSNGMVLLVFSDTEKEKGKEEDIAASCGAITDPIEEIRRLHLHQQASLDLLETSRNSIQTRDGTILQLDPTYRSFQACGRPPSNLLQRTSSFDGNGGGHCNCNCGDWLLDFDVDAVDDVDDPFGSILTVEKEQRQQKLLQNNLDQEKLAMEELADIFAKSTGSNQTQSPLPPSLPLLNGASPQQQQQSSPQGNKKPMENGSKLMNGHHHHPHHPLQNGGHHSHTLRAAKSTLAAAEKKCSTSSSGSGGTASMDSCGSGSGSGGSGGSGPPSGSSCKSNSSSGSGAGPGSASCFSSSHNQRQNHHHQRSFSQATTVSFQHALLNHHLSSVVCGTGIPFGQQQSTTTTTSDTLMDTAESGGDAAVQNGEPMSLSTAEMLIGADSGAAQKLESKNSDQLATDNSSSAANSNGGKSSAAAAAPVIADLLKEFDVCFNSADHIDDDSSTLTDNSSQQHSLSSPLKRKYIDTTTVANGSNSANGGGPLATPLTSSSSSSSKLPPPSGPPPPPPTSSCLSSSSSVNNNNSSVGCCSTSLAAINGGGDGGGQHHHQQCPPALSANVSTSTANGTPCKAAATNSQQQVPGGLSSANGGSGGPNLAAISGSISESAAEKLKDIELICLNEQAEEVQETIKRYRRGPICFDPRCISLKRRIGNGYFGDGMDGQDILRMFAENRRLAKPEKCPVAIYQLMWSCWQFKPEDRLNFAAINDQLTHYLAASTATNASPSAGPLRGRQPVSATQRVLSSLSGSRLLQLGQQLLLGGHHLAQLDVVAAGLLQQLALLLI